MSAAIRRGGIGDWRRCDGLVSKAEIKSTLSKIFDDNEQDEHFFYLSMEVDMNDSEVISGSCHCGAVSWTHQGIPTSATACNCTVCRRYGVLWAYDYEGEGISVSGATQAYIRGHRVIEFHFCPNCGGVSFWRSIEADPDGRRRIAVNLRQAEPEVVAQVPIDHFDGLNSFSDLPRDGRCVADYWF